jgi:hypothetical protein
MEQMLAYRPMKRALLPALLLLTTASFANDAAKVDVDVALEAGKVHEACERLEKGDRRRYHWKATAPVDFNIHYHRGNDVVFPVRRDGMRGDGGTFVAKTAEDYCWMWTARTAPARVTGQVLK